MNSDSRTVFEATGRVWFRNALPEHILQDLDREVAAVGSNNARLETHRIAATLQAARDAAPEFAALLGTNAKPRRILLFNKSADSNWGVPWHQDRVIAVNQRVDMPEFSNWSHKNGTWHCEPPLPVLRSMMFTRIHLDDTDTANGAMDIALGSHKLGLVEAGRAKQAAESCEIETCTAKRGDILVLKMTMLHRSPPATNPTARRALRVDFAVDELPHPLQWAF